MKLRKPYKIMSAIFAVAQCLGPIGIYAAENTPVIALETQDVYEQRFLELYKDIKDKNNGYFNKQGIPYHSVETLLVEAPDQGHESTSEAASYLLWLEAMNGKFTGDFSGVKKAWDVIEDYYIPTSKDQPGQSTYDPGKPATYAAEHPQPSMYPSELQFGVKVGTDPLATELKNAYGTSEIYGMHWLIDVDNFYGFGQRGDGTSTPSYINTYQRGEQESVWETVPQPSWESFNWGGPNGYLPIFTQDANYSKQWRYTNAPDADARAVQAMYRAEEWAKEEGQSLSTYVDKASKMGDYLRYSLFDKYFMKVGAQDKVAGDGREAEHYLLSWYYAWGGGIGSNWSWRIGSSHSHFGYQNPFAAWVLSTDKDFIPKSATAKQDWSKSLDRQIEFYQWLQSAEGGIAGGATNSLNGSYDKYPAGTSTFYGMAYDDHPVYEDPGSNEWFGMQCWSMQRMAELYYETGDKRVKNILDKWAKWANSQVELNADGTYAVPATLDWSGKPDTWTGTYTGNPDLHVKVTVRNQDVGVTASLANTLTYYAAGLKKHAPTQDYKTYVTTAKELLDRMWNLYRDDIGIGVEEVKDSYNRFFEQEVAIPDGFSGKTPFGDKIEPGATFASLRSQYKNDPDYARLEKCYKEGKPFTITYHRFWSQSEAAIANGVMALLFPSEEAIELPVVDITEPTNKDIFKWDDCKTGINVKANASIKEGKISKVEFYANGEKFAEDKEADFEATYVPTEKDEEVVFTAVAYADNKAKNESSEVAVTIQKPEKPTPEVPDPEKPDPEKPTPEVPDPEKPEPEKPTPEVPDPEKPEPEKPTPENPDLSVTVDMQQNSAKQTNTLDMRMAVKFSGEVNLSDVKIRYYFTKEGNQAQSVAVDNADANLLQAPWYQSLTGAISGNIVKVDGDKCYVEYSFSNDTKLTVGSKLNINARIYKSDWSNYDRSNDDSYNNGVVVMCNDQVIYGTMPY